MPLVEYLVALLDRKRTAPGEDLMTDLVVAADRDGALTEQETLHHGGMWPRSPRWPRRPRQ
jgi:cytochrome P450